jgi:hypothetical protein
MLNVVESACKCAAVTADRSEIGTAVEHQQSLEMVFWVY